ncbi:MAG: hypothetical protein OJF59_002932 [Cytophagales bacterium]|nr:DUF1573 domain-containing protein [Bacteroidota bacterium]MBS1979623.1 DUF1573 domain-containing protein [Bacteroidota bacterium]WHZ09176.1 MAG: hypothetical protein OJF59_002932 [Cytophagales bacterium]
MLMYRVTSAQTNVGAAITWEKSYFDFGDVVKGKKVEHIFKFTNTGTEPLIITNVEVTCGCTTPKGWPRDPIFPGSKAELIIQFDSTNKIGRQNKVVVVVSNAAAGNSQVTFSANVLEDKSKNQ